MHTSGSPKTNPKHALVACAVRSAEPGLRRLQAEAEAKSPGQLQFHGHRQDIDLGRVSKRDRPQYAGEAEPVSRDVER